MPKVLLIAALSVSYSFVNAKALNSEILEPILLAQNYSESDTSATKSDSGSARKKHGGHDDEPLFRYSYEVSVADDDNIRRAQDDEDIREDVSLTLKLKARGGTSLGRTSMLAYGGSLAYEKFDVFDDLNNFTFDTHIKYRFAGSAKFAAPVYTLGAKLGGIDSESEMRDSTTFALDFNFNKRITTAMRLTSGIGFNARESKSEVFDTRESRIFINLDLNLSRSVLIYTTYSFITGDIVSSATPSLEFINAADAIEPDDAFGGSAFNQFAYKLDADTNAIALGYNHILTRSISMDLSYQFVDSQAAGEIEYERNILRASLLGRF